mmetsp:Transcript_2712/g.5244  ORF Transcript_2712/g.5244 Transcript_2712/m.5244 type:complete len:326 (+) Transcript_2712:42-1019(+)
MTTKPTQTIFLQQISENEVMNSGCVVPMKEQFESFKSGTNPAISQSRHSEISQSFDRGAKGFLTESERGARELACNETGAVPAPAVVELVSKQRLLQSKVKSLTILNFINLIVLTALAIALGIVVSQGDKETQNVITESVHTKVEADPARGMSAVLVDMEGNVVSTVAEGHSVSATSFVDPNSGNKTVCVPMNDLVKMVLNTENGIKNTMSIKDQSGDVISIVNLEGDAEIGDEEVSLASGKYTFILNSSACTSKARRRRRLYNRKLFNEHLQSMRMYGNRRLQPGGGPDEPTDDDGGEDDDDGDNKFRGGSGVVRIMTVEQFLV